MSDRHPLARRLDDGHILLRYSTREPDGARIDGSVAIGPEDPRYASWNAEITRWEHSEPLDDSIDYKPIDYENLSMFPDPPPNRRR
ncbi:hypothetical protein IU483_28380 [Streptomyces gardneri]|nr:hypothetical protein [Streptomyces gardneri]